MSSPKAEGAAKSAVDRVVIRLVVSVVLYNLVQLSCRLNRSGGAKAAWHVQRTVLFWIIGLLNTAMIRPEHVGTWRHWVGWGFLILAALDSIALLKKERETVAAELPEP